MTVETEPMTVADKLRALAALDRMKTRLGAESWPDVVERAFHVGRASAFEEAARIVDETDLEPETGARTAEQQGGSGSC